MVPSISVRNAYEDREAWGGRGVGELGRDDVM